MIDLDRESTLVASLQSNLNNWKSTIEFEEEKLEACKLEVERTQQAQEILQRTAQAVQQKAHERIASVVTTCLKTVFGDEAYEFKILFERKRGRTEARLVFARDGLEVDPLTASGGGVVDVAAFALRVSCLMLHRPRLSRLIVLDEPFRFVSSEFRSNVRQMLEGLSEELQLQIIMVTHSTELCTGKIVEL